MNLLISMKAQLILMANYGQRRNIISKLKNFLHDQIYWFYFTLCARGF